MAFIVRMGLWEREGELVEELDVQRAQMGSVKSREDALEVRASTAVGKHAQMGESDTRRRGHVLQTPRDLAVACRRAEADRKRLEAGERSKLCG